jgi:hypothetical protein
MELTAWCPECGQSYQVHLRPDQSSARVEEFHACPGSQPTTTYPVMRQGVWQLAYPTGGVQ